MIFKKFLQFKLKLIYLKQLKVDYKILKLSIKTIQKVNDKKDGNYISQIKFCINKYDNTLKNMSEIIDDYRKLV